LAIVLAAVEQLEAEENLPAMAAAANKPKTVATR
jgi:hypothetical protein